MEEEVGLAELLSAFRPDKPTGLAGVLTGPLGGVAAGAAGSLLNAFGALAFGDGGKKKRLREAQSVFRQLINSQVNQAALSQGSRLFERSQLPTLNRLFSQSASRVGLDSGIGQGAALAQFADLLAGFNTRQLLNEQNRVAQDRRLGAQGLASIIDV